MRTWSRFGVYFLTLALGGALVLALLLFQENRWASSATLHQQQARLRLNAEIIGFSFKRFGTDALMLADLTSGILETEDRSPDDLGEIEALFWSFAQARGDYVQVRFLSAQGLELVRIERDGRHLRQVPGIELQNKSERPYVLACRGILPGEVHFSGPELNQEHGRVVEPWLPVVRACSPIAWRGGEGIVVLSFPARPFLHRLGERDADNPDVLWITDGRGSWARGPDGTTPWAADLGFPAGSSVQAWGGGAVAELLREGADSAMLQAGRVVVTRIDPAALVHLPAAGEPIRAHASTQWALVSFVPEDQILAPARLVRVVSVRAYLLFLLVGALGSLLLADAKTKQDRARKELLEQKELLADFLDSSGELIQSVDAQGRFLYVNRAWERALGWTQAEAQAMTLRDVVGGDRLTQVREALAALPDAAEDQEIDTVFVTREGERIEVRGTLSVRPEQGGLVARGYFRDVTVRNRALRQLEASEERYRQLVEHGLGLICRHDLDGVLLQVNPATAKALGYGRGSELEGRSLLDFADPSYRHQVGVYLRSIATRETVEGEFHVRSRDGQPRIWHFRNRRVDADSGTYVLGTALDVTELREANLRLGELALHDPLTGVANRRKLEQEMERSLALAARRLLKGDAVSFAVGILDLDGFKPVNDRLGHAAGDRVLRAVASVLQEQLRATDLVARPGGDEFAILLHDSGGEETLGSLAERILLSVESVAEWAVPGSGVTASLGLARLADFGTTGQALWDAADGALYSVKRAGGNAYRIATQDSALVR